jgi:hypothetical protein
LSAAADETSNDAAPRAAGHPAARHKAVALSASPCDIVIGQAKSDAGRRFGIGAL